MGLKTVAAAYAELRVTDDRGLRQDRLARTKIWLTAGCGLSRSPPRSIRLNPPRIELTALPGIPIIQPGDDLPGIILHAADEAGLVFQSGDVLVVAQKIISKAEGRLGMTCKTVTPSQAAEELANASRKDPAHRRTDPARVHRGAAGAPDLIVAEHRGGICLRQRGIDQSNAAGAAWQHEPGRGRCCRRRFRPFGATAARCASRTAIERTAVIISDSHGGLAAGTVGAGHGVAGLHP